MESKQLWQKQRLTQRCVCVGCSFHSDQALRLLCLKGHVGACFLKPTATHTASLNKGRYIAADYLSPIVATTSWPWIASSRSDLKVRAEDPIVFSGYAKVCSMSLSYGSLLDNHFPKKNCVLWLLTQLWQYVVGATMLWQLPCAFSSVP